MSPPGGALAAMDVAGRLDRVRALLGDAGCDGLLVTNLVNVRYLTGFTGSASTLLVTESRALVATDGRYRLQAAEQMAKWGVAADLYVGQPSEQEAALLDAAPTRLGLEAAHISWARQRGLAHRGSLVATVGLVEGLRRVKDRGEIDRIASAAAIADQALAAVLPMLGDGPTEADVALALDSEMRRMGAEGPSFETIVASGPNGARPHARPTRRVIGHGELVVIDFGALVDGYHSDMTRTVAIGDPGPTARRMHEVVSRSQAAGVAAVRPGAAGSGVDRACRAVIAEVGWADAFVHGTGHGVGLDIHEAPAVAATSTDTLAPGHVVTVEPGVYLSEHGGVRIEDTVVVTDEGCTTLTNAPKDLMIA